MNYRGEVKQHLRQINHSDLFKEGPLTEAITHARNGGVVMVVHTAQEWDDPGKAGAICREHGFLTKRVDG